MMTESRKIRVRTRSPRFPSHSLDEAIGYAKKIYAAVHQSSIDASLAFEIMGFSGKSGASATALGSIRQYGLIEGFGDKTRISELALEILEPTDSSELARAMRKAAFEPKVFGEISERFAGRIPTVDEPIRSFLIRDKKFSQSGAEECIKALRDTLNSLPDDGSYNLGAQLANDVGPTTIEPSDVRQASNNLDESKPINIAAGAATQIRLPLSKDCYAEITIFGEVNARSINNLKRQIDLFSDFWTDEDID